MQNQHSSSTSTSSTIACGAIRALAMYHQPHWPGISTGRDRRLETDVSTIDSTPRRRLYRRSGCTWWRSRSSVKAGMAVVSTKAAYMPGKLMALPVSHTSLVEKSSEPG
jgi:hypothetical protein